MHTKTIIALITMSFLPSSPCFTSPNYQHHEIASDNATNLVAKFLKEHHDEVKRSVIATHPFGEDVDYAQLSLGQQEQLDNFVSSQLIMEAQRALPLSMGEIIAGFMYNMHLDDLDENPYKEVYHDHGISNLQIKEASLLIRNNFHRLKTNIQENADVSRIPKKHQVDFLIQALGEEVIDLLQTNMKIDLAAAIEIYTYLQKLERIHALHKQEKVERDISDGIPTSSSSQKEKPCLVLASSFSESDITRPPSHLTKHWQTYAMITGGLGIAALVAFLKPQSD
ncbi:MAG TPA: hypothetical protein DD412_06415 [Holosporales bacterium]|nr:hypothetical protein [Holosporales bacterium]